MPDFVLQFLGLSGLFCSPNRLELVLYNLCTSAKGTSNGTCDFLTHLLDFHILELTKHRFHSGSPHKQIVKRKDPPNKTTDHSRPLHGRDSKLLKLIGK